jgi:hypothetical protein
LDLDMKVSPPNLVRPPIGWSNGTISTMKYLPLRTAGAHTHGGAESTRNPELRGLAFLQFIKVKVRVKYNEGILRGTVRILFRKIWNSV